MAALAAAAVASAASMLDVPKDAILGWAADPVKFVYDVFGDGYREHTGFQLKLDGWQDKFLRDRSQKKAVRACKNPGKTTGDALEGWNFLATRPDCNVIATSITGANLQDGLWKEMAKWQKYAPLLLRAFEWTSQRIVCVDNPGEWFMSARTWSRSATPEEQGKALAGVHSDFVLFLLDEAGGIPDAVAITAEAALGSGIESRIILTGNPTDLEGPLYRACVKNRKGWSIHEITGDPDREDRAPRVSKQWAEDTIAEFGRDSNYVRINVLGEFPLSSANALLSPDDVLAAMRRDPDEAVYQHAARVLGVDVARNGGARSVLFERQGVLYRKPRIYRDLAPHGLMTLAGHVAEWARSREPDAEFVDETGLGGGVVDRCRQLKVKNLYGVNFSEAARQPRRFRNRRAEMWWNFATHVKREGALPELPELVTELSGVRYRTDGQGRIELEAKDEIEKRLGFSPDIGDAGALTHAEPGLVAGVVRESETYKLLRAGRGATDGRADWDYDPLAKGGG